MSWLADCRRLRRRYERNGDHFQPTHRGTLTRGIYPRDRDTRLVLPVARPAPAGVGRALPPARKDCAFDLDDHKPPHAHTAGHAQTGPHGAELPSPARPPASPTRSTTTPPRPSPTAQSPRPPVAPESYRIRMRPVGRRQARPDPRPRPAQPDVTTWHVLLPDRRGQFPSDRERADHGRRPTP